MVEPIPKCFDCDQICDALLNEDHECWGRATPAERAAADLAILNAHLPQPAQPYGQPIELPVARIPEAQKHHVTRSGR